MVLLIIHIQLRRQMQGVRDGIIYLYTTNGLKTHEDQDQHIQLGQTS